MRKKLKKLEIKKLTLRNLSSEQLPAVKGGNDTFSVNPCSGSCGCWTGPECASMIPCPLE